MAGSNEYDWQVGDLADQSNYPPGVDPSAIGTAVKNWWSNQPSWAERAQAENQRTAEAFQRGGMGAVAQQLATDTTEAQDLAAGFGGNIKGVKPPLAPGALAAISEYRPPFYSAVEQAVQGAKQNAAPGQQWAGFLRNQPGIKPEEVEALKLGKLFEQPGSVSKEAVLGEIAANRVKVGEVVKGGNEYELLDKLAQQHYGKDFAWVPVDQQRLLRNLAQTEHGQTKFSAYTLPGGENYREMLLTLPDKGKSEYEVFMKTMSQKYGGELEFRQNATLAEDARMQELANADKQHFRSSHYEEPNILAHVRYNDRVIDGKKTLFVEEVQSDWHQKGKRQGYKEGEPKTTPVLDPKELGIESRELDWRGTTPDGRTLNVGKGTVATEAEARDYIARYLNQQAAERNMSAVQAHQAKVPDAPFKTTWPELAMKRIIREAAEKGYDKVAWTPGSVQAERYDLSKQVERINWARRKDGTHDISVYGADQPQGAMPLISKDRQTPEQLADLIGKEAAEKLTKSKLDFHHPEQDAPFLGTGVLKGPDLKVGGEGMKGFYDEILPATVNRLVKKHGGRVAEGTLPMAKSGEKLPFADMLREAGVSSEEWMAMTPALRHAKLAEIGKAQNVHTLDITPSLRAAAMKGFPLFTAGGVAATGAIGELARQDEYR